MLKAFWVLSKASFWAETGHISSHMPPQKVSIREHLLDMKKKFQAPNFMLDKEIGIFSGVVLLTHK